MDGQKNGQEIKDTLLKFWGTRGSICVSGSDYCRFGGNTSCLEVRNNESVVIFDAGTGIRALGNKIIGGKSREIHLILSHYHWDHILGFPFFIPLYVPGFDIHIYGPGECGDDVKKQFDLLLNPFFFPIGLKEMRATLSFHPIHPEFIFSHGRIRITCCPADHPGTTYMFKIQTPQLTVGYATDNEFLKGYTGLPLDVDAYSGLLKPYEEQIEFFQDCKIMVHEAQYMPESYKSKIGWGHTSLTNAAILMKIIKPDWWLIPHHDPSETDQLLLEKHIFAQTVLKTCNIDCNVEILYDEMETLL